MQFGYGLVREFAREIKRDIVKGVIGDLQGMTDCLQSGDDSCLENIWEELCVQVQGEESFFYSTYLSIVDDFIVGRLDTLPPHHREALSSMTEAGGDWIDEHKEGGLPFFQDEIVDDLRSGVLSSAADYENDRIERFKWGLDDGDSDGGEEDGDEDEEEEDADALEVDEEQIVVAEVSQDALDHHGGLEASGLDVYSVARNRLLDDFGAEFVEFIEAVAERRAADVVREMIKR